MERRYLNWANSRASHSVWLCFVSYRTVQSRYAWPSNIVCIFTVGAMELALISVWICEKRGDRRARCNTFPSCVITPQKGVMIAKRTTKPCLIVCIEPFRAFSGACFVYCFCKKWRRAFSNAVPSRVIGVEAVWASVDASFSCIVTILIPRTLWNALRWENITVSQVSGTWTIQ